MQFEVTVAWLMLSGIPYSVYVLMHHYNWYTVSMQIFRDVILLLIYQLQIAHPQISIKTSDN